MIAMCADEGWSELFSERVFFLTNNKSQSKCSSESVWVQHHWQDIIPKKKARQKRRCGISKAEPDSLNLQRKLASLAPEGWPLHPWDHLVFHNQRREAGVRESAARMDQAGVPLQRIAGTLNRIRWIICWNLDRKHICDHTQRLDIRRKRVFVRIWLVLSKWKALQHTDSDRSRSQLSSQELGDPSGRSTGKYHHPRPHRQDRRDFPVLVRLDKHGAVHNCAKISLCWRVARILLARACCDIRTPEKHVHGRTAVPPVLENASQPFLQSGRIPIRLSNSGVPVWWKSVE